MILLVMPLGSAIKQIWSQKNTHIGCKLLWSRNYVLIRQGCQLTCNPNQEASYCYGICFFWASIQTAPPSWDFCSSYQQPTSADLVLVNILWITSKQLLAHSFLMLSFSKRQIYIPLSPCSPRVTPDLHFYLADSQTQAAIAHQRGSWEHDDRSQALSSRRCELTGESPKGNSKKGQKTQFMRKEWKTEGCLV